MHKPAVFTICHISQSQNLSFLSPTNNVTHPDTPELMNNSAGDCSISLKFNTDHKHVHAMYYKHSKSKGEMSRSQHNLSAAKKRYKLRRVD